MWCMFEPLANMRRSVPQVLVVQAIEAQRL
jgi:hypothetical protein